MSSLKKYLLEGLNGSSTELTGDDEIFRLVVIAEADTVNFYQQLAKRAKNEATRIMLLDIAKEEKVHMYEAMDHLELVDSETNEVKTQAKEETEELLKKSK